MINEELILAYEQAMYIVETDKNFELRVGKRSEDLDKCLRQHNRYLAAFITPENPSSVQLTKQENALRHKCFLVNLKSSNTDFVKGFGVDDAEEWPREKSYLVFVKNKAHANQLAKSYGQNAYLLCEVNKPVNLIVVS